MLDILKKKQASNLTSNAFGIYFIFHLSCIVRSKLIVLNTIGLLADNGRLDKIDGVCSTFARLMSASRGEVVCEITSAKVNT